ncbi:sensor domain-containing protein [Bacillus marasmi]|uniref:sensor domain-containing protein n=1 Tax=Bacillus marasmi TaxID=1926279 RepID=UPI0011CA05F2|nr:GGDEF and EAL domain-containing protein [Bacillus marasmi]
MKYTWRIILAGIVFFVNVFNYQFGDFNPSMIFSHLLNTAIGWMIGLQIDKYLISKKELGTTKTVLLDYSFAMDSAAEAIGIMNEAGQFIFVNEAYANLYGYSKDEFLTLNWTKCFPQKISEHMNKHVIIELMKYSIWKGELIGVRKDGTTFPIEISLSHIKESKNTICFVRDITEQKNYEEHIKYIAEHNDLTDLPNRRRLLADLALCQQIEADTALLFLDLDHFKLINDTLGHDFGDELLKNVANRLLSFENDYIHAYHHGGDEFIMIVVGKDVDFVKNLAGTIILEAKKPYYIKGKELYVTASIGISRYPENTTHIHDLIKTADTAMYHAKLVGKDTFKFFTKKLEMQQSRKALIDTELRKVLKNKELFIVYQPKFDLTNGDIVGFEALLRWIHPELGIISPKEFIPIAEETGLITNFGKWVIHEVFNQLKIWKEQGFPLVPVSVNVSQRQFRDKELIKVIASSLKSYNIDAKYFEIEITESVVEDSELMLPTLRSLKELGINISIDDFGTGYSSLNVLKDLPIDTLKIDQSFIRDLLIDPKDYQLVKTIIEIGCNLGLQVVAEGIETKEQLNHLLKLKAAIGQGFYFSKPKTAKEIEENYLKVLA